MTRAGPLVRLAWVVGSSFTVYTMVLTLLPLYALRLGASVATVGLLTAGLSFVPLLLAVRTGSVVDRFGARSVLVAGSVVLALSPAFVLAWPGLPALFAVATAAGLANLLAVVAGQAYTAALGAGRRREGNFGWYTTFVSAGQVVGPVVAGVVADAAGFLPAFGAAGVLAFVAIASAWRLDPIETPGGAADRPRSSFRREAADTRTLLTRTGVPFAVAVTFAVAFSQGAFTAFFPVVLEAAGYGAAAIGTLLSVRAAVSMVLRPLVPVLTRVLGEKRRALKAVLALIVVTAVAIGADASWPTAVAVCVAMGVWWGLGPPLSIVMMVDGADASRRGFALGVRLMANRLAQLIGPVAMGLLAEAATLRVAFFGLGALVTAFLVPLLPSAAPDAPPGPAPDASPDA